MHYTKFIFYCYINLFRMHIQWSLGYLNLNELAARFICHTVFILCTYAIPIHHLIQRCSVSL